MPEALVACPPLETVRVRVLPDGRMTPENAALYLGRSTKTLETWRREGRGPKALKVGGRWFYRRDSLDHFINGEVA